MRLKAGQSNPRERRRARVRSHLHGTGEKPRLNVFRSLRGVFAQLIDDTTGRTLVSASSRTIDKKADAGERKAKIAASYIVGQEIAEKAKAKGITKAVFDRAGYQYHGRVQAVADGARDGGLEF